MPLRTSKLPILNNLVAMGQRIVGSPIEAFWRLVFSHEWFRINLQRTEVELEIMNSEPRV